MLNFPIYSGLLETFSVSLVVCCVILGVPGTDIIIILGSALTVERVLSGSRYTISLRRASLRPESIDVLMLIKKRLHLAHAQCTAALCR